MGGKYNAKNLGIKRIMQEAKELSEENAYEYCAQPLEDNLFEWHFTIRGPEDTEFAEGRYHGRILLPSEYPFKPPEIMFLTPNGRFELHKKICLSVTDFHPEFWQPAWGIRTILLAVIAFFPTHAKGAIGGLDYPPEERARLARESIKWVCPDCHMHLKDALPAHKAEGAKVKHEDMPNFSLNYKTTKETFPESSGGSNLNRSSQDKKLRDNAGHHTTSNHTLSQGIKSQNSDSTWIGALVGILIPFLALFIYNTMSS
ncbi:hypothetical protein G6F45_009434 [Rhizopus arrhizus]|nr:hypothetical protein G6F45_009434 [Rhizopus arrhizus]